jgi:hypothetical protein
MSHGTMSHLYGRVTDCRRFDGMHTVDCGVSSLLAPLQTDFVALAWAEEDIAICLQVNVNGGISG